ncbi:unnamed protein product [Merluccius merluccius]
MKKTDRRDHVNMNRDEMSRVNSRATKKSLAIQHISSTTSSPAPRPQHLIIPSTSSSPAPHLQHLIISSTSSPAPYRKP